MYRSRLIKLTEFTQEHNNTRIQIQRYKHKEIQWRKLIRIQ